MCGRYVSKDQASLERYYNLTRGGGDPFGPIYNAAPTLQLPIYRIHREHGPELVRLHVRLGKRDRMQIFPVWTWGGEHFGYLEGEYLWTYDGKNVARLRGEFIFAPDGSYLGEIRSSNRLLTGIGRKSTLSLPFTPKPARASIERRESMASSVMYIGYEDFPPPSAF